MTVGGCGPFLAADTVIRRRIGDCNSDYGKWRRKYRGSPNSSRLARGSGNPDQTTEPAAAHKFRRPPRSAGSPRFSIVAGGRRFGLAAIISCRRCPFLRFAIIRNLAFTDGAPYPPVSGQKGTAARHRHQSRL